MHYKSDMVGLSKIDSSYSMKHFVSSMFYKEEIHRRIERNAYFKWDNAGRPSGRDLEFWTAAEKEVLRGSCV